MIGLLSQRRWWLGHRGLGGTVQAAANAVGRKLRQQPPSVLHPFDAVLMRQLAKRLAAAFRERTSELEVLHYKPAQVDAFEMIWCEATGISAEDLAVDPVADLRDETRAYRARNLEQATWHERKRNRALRR